MTGGDDDPADHDAGDDSLTGGDDDGPDHDAATIRSRAVATVPSTAHCTTSSTTTPYDSQFITLLYRNLLDREPESGGLEWHLNELHDGFSRAQVLTFFSESGENQANVIGQIENGIVFIG